MTRRHVSITQAKSSLSELVHRVVHRDEQVILESHGRPRAVLIGLERFEALGGDPAAAQLRAERLEGLKRIEAICARIRKARRGRSVGDSAAELAALRRSRDDAIGRVR